MLTRGFKFAFVGWKDEHGQIWIVDTHRRKKVLSNLLDKELAIREIPLTSEIPTPSFGLTLSGVLPIASGKRSLLNICF